MNGLWSCPVFAIVATRLLPEAFRGVNKQLEYYSEQGKEIRRMARENGIKVDLKDDGASQLLTNVPPFTNVISLVGGDGFGDGEDF